MELYTMRYVLALEENRKFSAAAEECHIGQPALSQQIAKLEKELGTPLFLRNAHEVIPTEAGRVFVLRAREILQKASALEAEMHEYAGIEKGTLNLGIITSLQCIDYGEMISAFCKRYPDVLVNISQQGTYRLLDALDERTIDAAILNLPARPTNKGIGFKKLGEDHYSVAVPEGHPLSSRASVSIRELRKERFIFHSTTQVAAELCLEACRRAGFEPNVICRSASPTTTLYMVKGGLGLAFLPSEEFRTHAIPGVRGIPLLEKIVKQVCIAWKTDNSSPLVRAAVAFAEEWKPGK